MHSDRGSASACHARIIGPRGQPCGARFRCAVALANDRNSMNGRDRLRSSFRISPRRSAPELGPGSDRQCRAARPDGTDGPKVYPDGTGARRADGGGGVGLPDSLLTEPIVFPSEHGSVTARRQWCRAGCIMRTGRLLGVMRHSFG